MQHWQVDINLYEDGDTTTADAVLHTPAPRALKSRGKAHRRPDDPDVPEIGDEIAAAHALRRLASHLLEVAESDLQGVQADGRHQGIVDWSGRGRCDRPGRVGVGLRRFRRGSRAITEAVVQRSSANEACQSVSRTQSHEPPRTPT